MTEVVRPFLFSARFVALSVGTTSVLRLQSPPAKRPPTEAGTPQKVAALVYITAFAPDTNVLGIDDDVGYGLLRVTRDQPWQPWSVGNPVYNLLLQLFFEYGVALQHLELGRVANGGVVSSSCADAARWPGRSARRSPRTMFSTRP